MNKKVIYHLEHWNDSTDLDGLLFFAQLMKEMLFDYTIDSYKAPIFTTYSLCDELIDAYDLVESGFLSDVSIKDLKEEILWSLENDFVSEMILGRRYNAIIASLKRENDSAKYIDIVKNLYHLLSNKYINEIKRQLVVYVKSPKEKKRIRYLTKLFVSELLYWGYSQSHLFHENENYFFNPRNGSKIDSVDLINDFLEKFNFEEKEYIVIFKGNENFLNVCDKKFVPHIIIDDIPPEINVKALNNIANFKNLTDEWSCFITIEKIKAFDTNVAKTFAESHLYFLNNLIAYEKHQAEFTWSKECLVIHSDFVIQIYPEVNEMYKIRDCSPEKLTDEIEHFMKIVSNLSWTSTFNFGYSLNLHNYALKSNVPEIQLLNLWSAIETLLPPQKKDSIIKTFTSNICPVLGIKYIDKLINDFIRISYVNLNRKIILDTLSQIPGEYSDFEKFVLLLTVKEYEPILKDFASQFGRNPMLINRIHLLNEALNNSDSILKTLEVHDKRIKWHLSRIYRSRNLIAHKGIALNYLSPLLENSHFYYHVIIEMILETIERMDGEIDSLESIFNFIKFEHEDHIFYLKQLKNEVCTKNNFKELLGI